MRLLPAHQLRMMAGAVAAVLAISVAVNSATAQPAAGRWQNVAEIVGTIWGGDCSDSANCMLAVVRGLGIESNIQRSTDGGTTWRKVWIDTGGRSPFRHPMRVFDISYPTRDVAIVAADSGYIYRTSDGGETWLQTRIDTIRLEVMSISMYDAINGVAAIDFPHRLFVTQDGAVTWREVERSVFLPPGWSNARIREIAKTGPTTILCIVADSVNQRAARSTDNGHTWTHGPDILPQYPGATGLITSFIDTLNGWATSRYRFHADSLPKGLILRSSDGGLGWRIVVDSLPTISLLQQIEMVDELHGVVGAVYNIYRTVDGWATWTVDASDSLFGIAALIVRRGHKGLAVGSNGLMYRWSETSEVDRTTGHPFEQLLEVDVAPMGHATSLPLLIRTRRPSEVSIGLYRMANGGLLAKQRLTLAPGRTVVEMPVDGVASGAYIVIVESEDAMVSRRVLIVR